MDKLVGSQIPFTFLNGIFTYRLRRQSIGWLSQSIRCSLTGSIRDYDGDDLSVWPALLPETQ